MSCPIARAAGHQFDVTFVTCDNGRTLAIPSMHSLARYLDPRRSLVSAIGWLVFALSIGLVLAASAWVDDIVRTDLLDLRGRHLEQAAGGIVDELNLNFALKLQSARALAAMLATELHDNGQATVHRLLANLQRSSPELERIVVADAQGQVLASTGGAIAGANVAGRAWFALGLKDAKLGEVRVAPTAGPASGASDGAIGSFVELATSVTDAEGNAIGVIGIRLSKDWLLDSARDLRRKLREEKGSEALLLDAHGGVLLAAASARGKRLSDILEFKGSATSLGAISVPAADTEWPAHVERLGDGRRYLLARAMPRASDPLHALGWYVVVLEPYQNAIAPARFLQAQITAVLLVLGLLAALLGVLLARRVTRGLDTIARSADAVMSGIADRIAVPAGRNEAARLGLALDGLLTSLQREQSELQAMNAELDQRVAARARRIERLAEQARFAAVARERLSLARDLHDTLAHSMMAMLTEIRILRKLSATEPGAVTEELARAEETAQQGLKEARAAIAQLRFNSVRDAGLATALGDFVKMFVERTGIAVQYTSDAQAGAIADERAETLFRIAEEAMRNIQQHAGAKHVTVSLHASDQGRGLALTIADDGVGFDVQAAHPGHYGLAGLREQAQLIDAALTIDSAPRRGTTISIALAPEADA
jgi:signal transduction histidine kinase